MIRQHGDTWFLYAPTVKLSPRWRCTCFLVRARWPIMEAT